MLNKKLYAIYDKAKHQFVYGSGRSVITRDFPRSTGTRDTIEKAETLLRNLIKKFDLQNDHLEMKLAVEKSKAQKQHLELMIQKNKADKVAAEKNFIIAEFTFAPHNPPPVENLDENLDLNKISDEMFYHLNG